MIKKKDDFVRFKEVNVPALNVRANPSTQALITKVLYYGTPVECDKNYVNATWDHIVAKPNVEGYCMKKYLSPASPDTLAVLEVDPISSITIKPSCDAATDDKEKDDDIKKEEK